MMPMRLSTLGLLALLSFPAAAQQATDADLITAFDVSGSIKDGDEHLEFEGMAAAVLDPRFLQAITRGRHGRIGFAAFTWGSREFVSLVPWTLIASRADAEQVAARLRTARGQPVPGYAMPARTGRAMRVPIRRPWRLAQATDVSRAIEHAIAAGAESPFASARQIINVCANGIDNIGGGPAVARSAAEARGMILNGLILGEREEAGDIAAWFRDHVQAGPGSFVIEVRDFEDLAGAMLAKLVLELAAVVPRKERRRT
jgi:hypothetical protein